MTPEDLRKLFIKVSEKAVERYPASQYFYDDGKYVRHGFTCGGYHLWLRMPTRGDTHFEIGPVPITKVKPTEHLIVGAGTLPFDEMKAGMVSPKKLQFYWDMVNAHEDWMDATGVLGEFTWWYTAPGLEIFRSSTRTIRVQCQGDIHSAEGVVGVFDIPAGADIPADRVALIGATAQGTPPIMVLKNGSGLYGCVRIGDITKITTPEALNINIAEKPYIIERIGGKFTIKEKEDMKFDIPTVKKETTAKVENEKPLKDKIEAEKETTNPPVVPVAAEKPVKTAGDSLSSPEEVSPDTPEPTLRERLEKAFSDAETLKTLAAELLKELRPILKEATKLEKSGVDSAEVKDLRSKNKTLEAENTRLKGAVKLLSEKL